MVGRFPGGPAREPAGDSPCVAAAIRAGSREGGVTILEVAVSAVFLAMAVLAVLNVMRYSLSLDATNTETAVATQAARQVIERMQSTPFRRTFAEFNSSPEDDPDGAGTGAGSTFAVEGMRDLLGDGGSAAGEIVFPEGPGGTLREDGDLPALGLPLDLDGDGAIDAEDHAGDYAVLPVLVRVRWRGSTGERGIELHALLRERGGP